MKCERCGREFPNKFYFAANTNICGECFEKAGMRDEKFMEKAKGGSLQGMGEPKKSFFQWALSGGLTFGGIPGSGAGGLGVAVLGAGAFRVWLSIWDAQDTSVKIKLILLFLLFLLLGIALLNLGYHIYSTNTTKVSTNIIDSDESQISTEKTLEKLRLEREMPNQEELYKRFLNFTYKTYISGALSHLSKEFEQKVTNLNQEEFVEKHRLLLETINIALEKGRLTDDEFLVDIHDNSFLMTNKMLYLFEKNSISGPISILPLRNIEEYQREKSEEGFNLIFKLKSGRTLKLDRLNGSPLEKYIDAFKN